MELLTGKVLAGRYEILKPLGSGGFGRTFLARDRHLPTDNSCVIKQFKPIADDPETIATARRLFATEAKILYELGSHTDIPRLFAYFEEDGEFFLVQEYIEGEVLSRELLSGIYQNNENKVKILVKEILEILAYIHQKNVIHRDVNPYNIIRRKGDNRLVLIDFGAVKAIATDIGRSTKTIRTVAIGTPGYLPGEQAQGNPRFSSDLYAVGKLAIQALTGRSPVEIPVDPGTEELQWYSLTRNVSEPFRQFIDRLVRYDFRQRYTSAAEALAVLDNIDRDTGPTRVAPVRRSSRRRKRPSFIIISGTIALLTGAYLGFNVWQNSRNVKNFYERARTLYELKRYDESLSLYNKAIAINPEDKDSLIGLGDTYLAMANYKKALESYEKAIQSGVDTEWRAWSGRGKALARSGKNREAIDSLERSLTINPQDINSLEELTGIYLKLEEYSLARQTLDKLLTLDPNNDAAWFQKGWADQNLKEYERAIGSYDRAIAIKGDNPNVWYQRGNCLNNLGKLPEALESYIKATRFDPGFAAAYYSQGILLNRLGRTEEAIQALENAAKNEPKNYQNWYRLGGLLHQVGRYREARNAYNRAGRIRNTAEVHIGLGNAWFRELNYQEAVTAYTRALKITRDNPDVWNSAGDSWMGLKNYDRAIEAYKRALEYRANDTYATKRLEEAEKLRRENPVKEPPFPEDNGDS